MFKYINVLCSWKAFSSMESDAYWLLNKRETLENSDDKIAYCESARPRLLILRHKRAQLSL